MYRKTPGEMAAQLALSSQKGAHLIVSRIPMPSSIDFQGFPKLRVEASSSFIEHQGAAGARGPGFTRCLVHWRWWVRVRGWGQCPKSAQGHQKGTCNSSPPKPITSDHGFCSCKGTQGFGLA